MTTIEVSRRTMLYGMGALAGAMAVAGCSTSSGSTGSSTTSSTTPTPGLVFDPTAFTEKTTTVTTDAGDKRVVYKFFGPITYVTNPSDTKYQSLVISVPTSIDGKAVDATNAPIVFANSVGGYMPATVATATEVGEQSIPAGVMGGATTGGGAPAQTPGSGVQSGSSAMLGAGGGMVSLAKLAVAAGYVAVEPGCRGRSLTDAKGDYYGVAPAVIVDLKAAVRYIRSNKDRIPGNTDRIVSTGSSAGGAVSALLGASGDSPLYDSYLSAVGAATASDAVFASGDWCPITDLEHADSAYEWNWGTNPSSTGAVVDQTVSTQLKQQFATYQASLKLNGLNNFGQLTAENYNRYLLQTYLQPSATRYLAALSATERTKYLAANPSITYTDGKATFSWADYLTHVGTRKKSTPAFDAFDLSTGENNEFGLGTTKARHFTDYSMSKNTTGLTTRRIDKDIPEALNLMNPMYHLGRGDTERAKHWWIRLGTKDSDTALTVSANLAAAVSAHGETVDHRMYWDAGHGANDDAADFITWISNMTG